MTVKKYYRKIYARNQITLPAEWVRAAKTQVVRIDERSGKNYLVIRAIK